MAAQKTLILRSLTHHLANLRRSICNRRLLQREERQHHLCHIYLHRLLRRLDHHLRDPFASMAGEERHYRRGLLCACQDTRNGSSVGECDVCRYVCDQCVEDPDTDGDLSGIPDRCWQFADYCFSALDPPGGGAREGGGNFSRRVYYRTCGALKLARLYDLIQYLGHMNDQPLLHDQ